MVETTAPDKEKIELFVKKINDIKTELPEVTTEKAQKLVNEIDGMLDRLTQYIKTNNNNL